MSVQALSAAFALRGLSPSEKLVLLALANFANEGLQCWPSQERLAADTELSARTVWSALKGLEERGVLVRESRKRSDGTRATDVFTLNLDDPKPVAKSAKPTRKSCETQSQILQDPVATVATLTTFEPSVRTYSEANASDAEASNPNKRAWADAVGLLVGQGGMKPEPAKAFFGRLLATHKLEAGDLLGPLGDCWNNRTLDPKAYLAKAAQTRSRAKATGPPKRVGFV